MSVCLYVCLYVLLVKYLAKKPRIRCPHCSSTSIWKRGAQMLSKIRVQRYQCKECGYLFTGRQPIIKLPNPIAVRKDFFRAVENLDSFITLVSTHESMTHGEFHNRLHLIRMEILRIWHQINLLTMVDKQYSKAFEKLRRILINLVDLSDIEKKYGILFWEHNFQKGNLRKDLTKFLRSTSKQIKKVQKHI